MSIHRPNEGCDQALDLFTVSLNSFYQAGSGVGWATGGQVQGGMALLFAQGTVVFDRIDQPEIAATLYGTTTTNPAFILTIGFAAAVDHVRDALGTDIFDNCARTGATMTFTEAVHYARHHIENVR